MLDRLFLTITFIFKLRLLGDSSCYSFSDKATTITSQPTQINAARLLQHVININESLCIHKYIHTNKYIEHQNNNNKHERKTCCHTYIQTVVKDFSRSRECENSISETFVRLNMLDYKKAEQSDHKNRSN